MSSLSTALQSIRSALLAERSAEGYWCGELSSSALSTATAVGALASQKQHAVFELLIRNGLQYLADHQNADGGWGDTEKSLSNISTTMLARAAFHIAQTASDYEQCLSRANCYIHRVGGIAAVRARYGKDKTFAVPILMMCALAGQARWGDVDPLPFELACVSPRFFAALRLPVVSYALPALIAIGQARFSQHPPRNLLMRAIRHAAIEKSLQVLESIQPTSGGFLEATPLTSFVTMALTACGQSEHPVTKKCIDFLVNSVRRDGSWAIDSNLSCWLTTLSVNAFGSLTDESASATRNWILRCQFRELHPYTNAAPGGWGWTHLPGSVPDADDTAGAVLALQKLPPSDESRAAMGRGAQWLLDLQNSDGGWPTFCRGWTNLPFDRSGADLTAHAIRALCGLRNAECGARKMESAVAAGFRYLANNQRPDGTWLPLWFGNQHVAGEENPVYGTSRVLAAYNETRRQNDPAAERGRAWLVAAQNDDGGWGGAQESPSSSEETSLAVSALFGNESARDAVDAGVNWLVNRIEDGLPLDPSPIGFYFAKLWYFERLYPLIFAVEALQKADAAHKTGALAAANR